MSDPNDDHRNRAPWRRRLHEIIFEADTRDGKLFDVVLLVAILCSVFVVILDSIPTIDSRTRATLRGCEWVFTGLFTVEYVLRMLSVRRPFRYATSFFGIVDLVAILPSYLALFLGPGSQSVLIVRVLRMLRIFRIFKLVRFVSAAGALRRTFLISRAKITVFLAIIAVVVTIMGTAMHVIEGDDNEGFESIPQSMYWGVVTLTTVGYGDAAPRTPLGKAMAAAMMVIGYSLIIVPTSIVSARLLQGDRSSITTQFCPDCSREGHEQDANHCKYCGGRL